LYPDLQAHLNSKADILSISLNVESPKKKLLNQTLEYLAFRNYNNISHRNGHLQLLAEKRNTTFNDSKKINKIAQVYSKYPENDTWNCPDSFFTCLKRTVKATALKESTVSFRLQYGGENGTRYFIGKIAHSGRILDTAMKLFEKQLIMLLIFSVSDRDNSEFIPENLLFEDHLSFGELIGALKVRVISKINSCLRTIIGTNKNWQVGFIAKSEIGKKAAKYFEIGNHPNTFSADPFIFEEQGTCYLFFERYNNANQRGRIDVLTISGETITELGSVLEEESHLSYPFVLKVDDEILMCPETSEMGEIRMYRASQFPNQWTYKETIFENVSAVDSNLFFHGGKWWLSTNIDSGGLGDFSSELWLFHSTSLKSPTWVSHTKNPIYVDATFSRNGGIDLSAYPISRMAQKPGFGIYGQGVTQRQIVLLTESEFKEDEIGTAKELFKSNYEISHHISTSQNFIAFDFISRLKPKK
jgi:hypothetical protein